jgi:methyl-accepting chemotaxis protein
MVDRQTDGIAQSTAMIQHSVNSVKGGLSAFASDARANGGQLHQAQERLSNLEMLSGEMLDRLAGCGVPTDDSIFIERARSVCKETQALIEAAIAGRYISEDAVFDTVYVPMAGTNPIQYQTRFCVFADAHVRPLLDRLLAEDPRHIGAVISDMNGYLPTHVTARSQPQGSDPAWNAIHCRNRRNLLDDVTQRAIESEREAMLVTYRMNLGEGRYLPVKNVFVPLRINGRRWGNFELAYRDEALR